MNNEYNIFFWLNVIANLLQIENYQMLLEDATNTDLMKELQNQDKILNEEINAKLDKILELLQDKEQ